MRDSLKKRKSTSVKKIHARSTNKKKTKTKVIHKNVRQSKFKRVLTKRSEVPVYNHLKLPKKSSFKKRSSAGLKVVWSPKVKHIERTPKKSHIRKSRHNPLQTNIYIKFNGTKTIKNSGILHAQYKNNSQLTPIVVFKLHDSKNNIIINITLHLLQRVILHIKYSDENKNSTQLLKQMKNGNERIRLLFKFGDIIWLHGKTEIYRKCNAKGFNIRWLQEMYDSNFTYDY